MKIKLLLLFIILGFNSHSQNITGKVFDSDKKPLELATVAVINPLDSALVSYANTNDKGFFNVSMETLEEGIVQIHYVGFETYQKRMKFPENDINLGNIVLKDGGVELDDVTVVGYIPVKVKEDTIAYNAKAFNVRVDDNVEDLLKKLPGVEVDVSGNITAQGEEVSKVYVDGKEFFSGDPKIATKNLSADAIKSVEIIDEKSEKGRITGINDAQRTKVLNLKLKDDSKVNDFGKFQGGYGTDNRYVGSFNYNRFTEKWQASVLGRLNNINSSGSDISEAIVFGGGGRGGMFSMGTSGGNSDGFVTSGVLGANLGYEFKKQQNLTIDYNFNHTDYYSGKIKTDRTEFIQDREVKSKSESYSNSNSNSNRVNFSYRDRSSETSSMFIFGNFNFSNNENSGQNSLTKDDGLGNPNLESKGKNSSESNSNSYNMRLRYSKRFSEDSKRNMSVNFNVNGNNSDSQSMNLQDNRFSIGTINENHIINRTEKSSKDQSIGANLSVEYNEPITDNHLIEVEGQIGFDYTNEDVNQANFENDVQVNPLIYDYYYNNLDFSGRTSYLYNKESFSMAFGVKFDQENLDFGLRDNSLDYTRVYRMINPTFYIMNRPGRGKFMRIQIDRSMVVPSAKQLYPVENNFNPLYITTGNIDLQPETSYSANIGWGNFDFESGNTFGLFGGASYNTDAIVTSEFTDSLNIRRSSFVNLGERSSANLRFTFGKRVASLGIRFNTSLSANFSNYLTLINNVKNETWSRDAGFGLSIENNEKEKFDVNAGGNWNYNYTTFSNGNNANRSYFQQSYFVKADWNISERLNVNSQFTYSLFTDSNFGTDISAPIWNAGITYSLLASKRLAIGVTAMDILNRNIGVSQSSGDNYFQEIQRDVLSNYYMFTLTYSLNNSGKKPTKRRGFFRRR
jgi:hypothetical protein